MITKVCKQCGNSFDLLQKDKQKRLCSVCRKDNNVQKAKKFIKEKDLVRLPVYSKTREKLKELASKENMSIYDYLEKILK